MSLAALLLTVGRGTADPTAADDPQIAINAARQCLLTGLDAAAEETLCRTWSAADLAENQRERAAFYLGLLADRRGDEAVARDWYVRAGTLAANEEERAFLTLLARLAKIDTDKGGGLPFVFTSLADPAAGVAPDHSRSRAALRLVQQARDERPQGSLENRIKLMSALLLHAEFASNHDEDLYTLANDHYAEGMQLYDEIKKELDADAKGAEQAKRPSRLEQLLLNPNTAAVVMRWDAIQVRWSVIKEMREPASRQQERERIRHLQDLVRTYRDCTAQVSLAMTQAMLGDAAAAEQSLQEAETHYARIEQVATQEPRDFYLLTPEPGVDQLAKQDPDPDAQIPYVATPPFGTRFAAQLKAVRALVKLQNAELVDVAQEGGLDAAMHGRRQLLVGFSDN